MSCNNGIFLGKHFTQIQGTTIGGSESASVTDIFGAEYIDKKAMEEGPMEPEDWKRYRDDTLDIKENCLLPTLHEDPQCKAIFPKKAFRTSYRRGYAHLKELLAPSKTDNKEMKKRNYNGSCSKCGKCGQSNRGKKRSK